MEDLPFDIPDNWTWIRLTNISQYGMGQTILTKDMFNSGIPVYSATIDDKPLGYIKSSDNKINLHYDDLVIPARGNSIGYVTQIKDKEASCTQTTIWMKLYIREIVNYLVCFFKGYKDKLFIFSGGAIPQVTITMMQNYLMPLPPLEEQQRIVNKINSFEPLLQGYDSYEKKLTELESTFAEKLKKSILQYAIEGKLVKQDPNDEPASVLLERIKAEKEKLIKEGKIKRDKNESFIYQGDDKNYYENLPSGWVLTNLSKVISLTSGTDLKPEEYSQQNIGVPYITGASNISRDNKIIINRFTHQKYVNSHLNEILLSCKGTIGKIVNNNVGDIHVARQFMSINSFINKEFLIIYLHTLVAELSSEAKSMIPGIDRNQVLSKALALPPLKEQIRIVSKVNNLIFF